MQGCGLSRKTTYRGIPAFLVLGVNRDTKHSDVFGTGS